MLVRKVAHCQGYVARVPGWAREVFADVSPDHPADERALVDGGGLLRSNRVPVAKDGDAVRQANDLREPVRDVDDTDALRAEPIERLEEGFRLGFG